MMIIEACGASYRWSLQVLEERSQNTYVKFCAGAAYTVSEGMTRRLKTRTSPCSTPRDGGRGMRRSWALPRSSQQCGEIRTRTRVEMGSRRGGIGCGVQTCAL